MNLYELHQKMTGHLFPAYSSEDERFLALALCGEAGELANNIKKRWRDGADLADECRDEIADIRVYLELLAKCFDIEGEKLDTRVESKLAKVVERFRERLSAREEGEADTERDAAIASSEADRAALRRALDRERVLEAEVVRLKEALSPVLAAGELWLRSNTTNETRLDIVSFHAGAFTVGDLRRARAVSAGPVD